MHVGDDGTSCTLRRSHRAARPARRHDSALLALAPRLRIPYPILLVLGGLALGFVPGIPDFELPPELVLVGVLPPLLYSSAFFTSLRDLRANARPIGLLAVGLVLMTIVVVAVVAHDAIGLSWATRVRARRRRLAHRPDRGDGDLEAARRAAAARRHRRGREPRQRRHGARRARVAVVAAVRARSRSGRPGSTSSASSPAGSPSGSASAGVVRQVRRRIDDPPVEVTISLLTGYFAFIPADLLHVSGVVAVVTAGVYLGWHTPELTSPDSRLLGDSMWEITTFVLNALALRAARAAAARASSTRSRASRPGSCSGGPCSSAAR